MEQNIITTVDKFITSYTAMDIEGIVINCPYWMNKLKEGKVAIRGFANGKGSAEEIRGELIRRLNKLRSELQFELTPENLGKFAKRERIGIDCSGFVYRVLDKLVELNYRGCNKSNLEDLFNGGINRTNTKILLSKDYCYPINKVSDYRLGDMIRLRGGKHIAVIISVDGKQIIYAHSSHLSSKIQGVHTAVIRILSQDATLAQQEWTEETTLGDGIFRLKIFS